MKNEPKVEKKEIIKEAVVVTEKKPPVRKEVKKPPKRKYYLVPRMYLKKGMKIPVTVNNNKIDTRHFTIIEQ